MCVFVASLQVLWSDACMIVYNITQRSSFEYAAKCLAEFKSLQNAPTAYLVGNKADLDHLREVRRMLRQTKTTNKLRNKDKTLESYSWFFPCFKNSYLRDKCFLFKRRGGGNYVRGGFITNSHHKWNKKMYEINSFACLQRHTYKCCGPLFFSFGKKIYCHARRLKYKGPPPFSPLFEMRRN